MILSVAKAGAGSGRSLLQGPRVGGEGVEDVVFGGVVALLAEACAVGLLMA